MYICISICISGSAGALDAESPKNKNTPQKRRTNVWSQNKRFSYGFAPYV